MAVSPESTDLMSGSILARPSAIPALWVLIIIFKGNPTLLSALREQIQPQLLYEML